jgi:NAD(P)-dependent dehydrogenase (short-subunit alcohol dehydrogenase family)
MGRASALVIAREGRAGVGCDLSVGAAQATVELVRGTGGEMVSKQLRHLDALFSLAATAYLNRLEDISDEEWDRAPATRSTSSCGIKVW